MTDPIEANRHLWNGWADLHVTSEYYDVEGFVADPAARPFDPIVRGVVGEIAGKRALHLQCHFGMDTLRLAMMGASVTGVDFSHKAIAAARALADRAGVDATFVEAEVGALPESIPRGAFDVVFTSYGVLSWLPDLEPWAATIASRLAPGGVFCIIEIHPTLWMFDEERMEPPLTMRYPYFGKEPLRFDEHGSYAVPDGDFDGESYSWPHDFEDIVGSLIGQGLVVESLREYPVIAWKHIPFMVRSEEGMWRFPPEMPDVPLMFSLTARKP